MLQLGYFEIAYNENNHLKITASGSDILFGRAKATLAVIRHEEVATQKGKKKKVVVAKVLPFGLEGGENEDLFEALRGLRKQLADQEALCRIIIRHLHCLSCSCKSAGGTPNEMAFSKSALASPFFFCAR